VRVRGLRFVDDRVARHQEQCRCAGVTESLTELMKSSSIPKPTIEPSWPQPGPLPTQMRPADGLSPRVGALLPCRYDCFDLGSSAARIVFGGWMSDGSTTGMASGRSTLERWGRASWQLIGIIAVASVVYAALAALSGLAIPLVVAVVIGMLAVPLVDGLERRKIPRSVGASLVLVFLLVVIMGSVAITVNGVIDQGDEIAEQLTAGLDSLDRWLEDLDIDAGVADQRVEQVKDFGVDLIPGVATWFGTAFSGVVSFMAGALMGLFLLYFILADWDRLQTWVGGHLGVPQDLGRVILDDVTSIIRQGFSALTVSSIVTAVIIGLTMVVLGVPLAFTVALVTFVTSYVPYIGAIFSGAFAFLVALGAAGPTEAFVLLLVILVVQNLVQTIIATKLTSDRLALHPIASLVSTIVGASLAGLLGAMLSAPVLAMIIQISRRVRSYDPSSPAATGRVEGGGLRVGCWLV
jgi:predicted PurR-regulated permease PerM